MQMRRRAERVSTTGHLYSSNSRALGALMNTLYPDHRAVRLKVQQGRAGAVRRGVAARPWFPQALAFYLVGWAAPFWVSMPTRPLWPLKLPGREDPRLWRGLHPAGRWDSDSPNTFSWLTWGKRHPSPRRSGPTGSRGSWTASAPAQWSMPTTGWRQRLAAG